MGFPRNRVEGALHQTNGDQMAALDLLLTSPEEKEIIKVFLYI
jgi:hypothetical protein